MLLPAVLLAPALWAHNTLFGPVPRTIWKDGVEVEAETGFEWFHRFFNHDSSISNPRGVDVLHATFQAGLTYGISRDWAARLLVPVGYATRTSKDENFNDTYFGLHDLSVGVKYRLYNDPFPGGSIQSGVFAATRLPVAKKRSDAANGLLGDPISFGDETWGFSAGGNFAWSTREHYFWFDVAAHVSTLRSGMGEGPSLQFHPSYAVRVFELTDYRDFDLILLLEADLEFAGNRFEEGKPVKDTGYYKLHMSFGIQVNITNRVEMKLGYEMPVYQYYFGTVFVHEGTAKLSFNYLV